MKGGASKEKKKKTPGQGRGRRRRRKGEQARRGVGKSCNKKKKGLMALDNLLEDSKPGDQSRTRERGSKRTIRRNSKERRARERHLQADLAGYRRPYVGKAQRDKRRKTNCLD